MWYVPNVTCSRPSSLGTPQSSLLGPRPKASHAHRVRRGPPAPCPRPSALSCPGHTHAPHRDHGPGWYQLFTKHKRQAKIP